MQKLGLMAVAVLGLAFSGVVYADSEFERTYFKDNGTVTLSEQERANLNKAEEWENKAGKGKANSTYVNRKGSVVYSYGTETPTVVCSIMQICDIELETGESINSVNIGDPARWSVEAAVAGSGDTATQHLLVKPYDTGLETSMMIATDRRGYRIKLKSMLSHYMPHISFTYPEKLNAQLQQAQLLAKEEKKRNSISTPLDNGGTTKTYLGNLNFNYDLEGDVSWKPVRVYDDGRKTIIEMPDELQYRTAPALMLLADRGGIFTDETTEIINYRMQGNRYVVDGIFDTAILTLDLDDRQQRVVITRNKK